MSGGAGKQYGLILSKKGGVQDVIQRPSIFDEGSDSGDSGQEGGDWIKKAYQREAAKSVEKRQSKIQIKKALSQDPSIFQYDEVYDDLKEKSNATPKKEEKKQSRYIQSLKRNAERRKLENERRLERQVQKEREQEGEEFKDKDTFVTSSYKKKLEEFQKMDEEEKRMDRLEEIGDVTKQKDISGFYRHLYKTTVDTDTKQEPKVEDLKTKPEEKLESTVKKSPIKETIKENFKQIDNKKQKRQYRKRKRSASSREEGEKTSSSSSYTSSSSSSESEEEPKEGIKKTEIEKKREKTPEKRKRSISRGKENVEISSRAVEEVLESKKKKSDSTGDSENTKGDSKSELVSELQSPSKEVKSTVNIWQKRTVGAAFDDALKRFMDRKSKRQGSY